jgi:hypothetical protein
MTGRGRAVAVHTVAVPDGGEPSNSATMASNSAASNPSSVQISSMNGSLVAALLGLTAIT